MRAAYAPIRVRRVARMRARDHRLLIGEIFRSPRRAVSRNVIFRIGVSYLVNVPVNVNEAAA